MRKLIAPVIGVALAVGALAWWMNRPHPDWAVRTERPDLLEVSIVGRDGAEEKGALWISCRGGAPEAAINPGPVQFVGGGTSADAAYLDFASFFLNSLDGPRSAPMQTWVMPPGKGFFQNPAPAEFIHRLSESEWYEAAAMGRRSMRFHVRRLGAVRERILAACNLTP